MGGPHLPLTCPHPPPLRGGLRPRPRRGAYGLSGVCLRPAWGAFGSFRAFGPWSALRAVDMLAHDVSVLL